VKTVSRDLVLHVKRIYFEQIRDGSKPEEFRLCSLYWKKRLEGRSYDRVIVALGYPQMDDSERILTRPWKGFMQRRITHPHFGDMPVDVFAIDVRRND
jgi:hypothetical protein